MARGADGKKWFMQPLMAASKIPAAKLTIRARKNSLINFRTLHPLCVNVPRIAFITFELRASNFSVAHGRRRRAARPSQCRAETIAAKSDPVMRGVGDACVRRRHTMRRRPTVTFTLPGYPDRGSEYDITVERRRPGKAGDSLIIRQGQDASSQYQPSRLAGWCKRSWKRVADRLTHIRSDNQWASHSYRRPTQAFPSRLATPATL
jgi:hypothetical protein